MKHLLPVCIAISAFLFNAHAFADNVNILAASYANPNFSPDGQAMWGSLAATAERADRNFRIRAILNPDSGPGRDNQILSDRFDEYFVNNGALAQRFIDGGGELIGYVSTLSGNRDLNDVTRDIDEYMSGTYSGKVAGVFLDDFYNNPDANTLGYYQDIYDHIEMNHAGAVIIGNAGNVGVINALNNTDALNLLSPLNTLVSHEMDPTTYINSFVELEDADAIGNENLSHLIHSSDAWDGSLLDLAVQREAGWFYATMDDLSQDPINPWDDFDTGYWDSMTDSVIAVNAIPEPTGLALIGLFFTSVSFQRRRM